MPPMKLLLARLAQLDHADPIIAAAARSAVITSLRQLLRLPFAPLLQQLARWHADWSLRNHYRDLALIESEISNQYALQKYRHQQIAQLEADRRLRG